MIMFWIIFGLTACITVYGFYKAIKERTLSIGLLVGSIVIGYIIINITSEFQPNFILFAWLTAYSLIMIQGINYTMVWNTQKSTKPSKRKFV